MGTVGVLEEDLGLIASIHISGYSIMLLEFKMIQYPRRGWVIRPTQTNEIKIKIPFSNAYELVIRIENVVIILEKTLEISYVFDYATLKSKTFWGMKYNRRLTEIEKCWD